jgi:hypothetical protein
MADRRDEETPYEGEEATAPPGGPDPDELTGPGGELPSIPGATPADDPPDRD